MKKRIIFLVACVTLIITLVGCKKTEENKVPNDNKENVQQTDVILEKPINETYEIANTLTKFQELLGENSKILTKEEIDEKYQNDTLKELEKQTIVYSDEENYEEITIVKLSDINQYFEIQQAMTERYESLKKEFAENEKILDILKETENLKIKIQDNVAIFIVSTRADEIIKMFDENF